MALTKSEILQPTLWRTCRALASKTRLRVLSELCAHPDQRVTDIARRLKFSLPLASQSLRALNARGLLLARRSGPSVCYRLGANRSIPYSEYLLQAVRKTLANDKNALRHIFLYSTAFTHPRRILIIKTVRERSLRLKEIAFETKIPSSALDRHLIKLIARGFLKHVDYRYSCSVPCHEFARVLLLLVRQV
ncbi:MAG: ArsR family transcriptional regulator [Lentisphaerae bacterium]|nr:ArsR family transcriptional regulator [Lentisphaerota bacterium]